VDGAAATPVPQSAGRTPPHSPRPARRACAAGTRTTWPSPEPAFTTTSAAADQPLTKQRRDLLHLEQHFAEFATQVVLTRSRQPVRHIVLWHTQDCAIGAARVCGLMTFLRTLTSSPPLNGEDSCRAAHAAPRRVPVSAATAGAGPGLTSPPQAFSLSARPAARMFFAALTSRSCTTPQPVHCHTRTRSALGPFLNPHAEQTCVVGSHRPMRRIRDRSKPPFPRSASAAATSQHRPRTLPYAYVSDQRHTGPRHRPLGCHGPAAGLSCAHDRDGPHGPHDVSPQLGDVL